MFSTKLTVFISAVIPVAHPEIRSGRTFPSWFVEGFAVLKQPNFELKICTNTRANKHFISEVLTIDSLIHLFAGVHLQTVQCFSIFTWKHWFVLHMVLVCWWSCMCIYIPIVEVFFRGPSYTSWMCRHPRGQKAKVAELCRKNGICMHTLYATANRWAWAKPLVIRTWTYGI